MARNADDLLADLDSLGVEETTQAPPPSRAPGMNPAASRSATSLANASVAQNAQQNEDEDVLADLQAQLAAKPPQPASRPSTPRLSSSTTSGGSKGGRVEHTPASSGQNSGRNSEDRLRTAAAGGAVGRKSGESTRSFHQPFRPEPVEDEKMQEAEFEPQASQEAAAPSSGGGGWGWGSLFSAASAAVKQAESIAKDLRSNEEAQRWAQQVRGNLGNLQSLGADLRSKALPTFTSVLQHIAPPISAHERLQIHATHDIQNYPSLDPLIYSTFSRIMSQVEGGDLMVIQRGTESRSRQRAGSEVQGYRGGVLGSGGGWSDGPWWRDERSRRSLGSVPGLREGSRLARVSAESYAKEFFDSQGGVEAAAQKATETLSETNPVRSSDIFLAIQAISYTAENDLFADSGREEGGAGAVAEPEQESEELVAFAVYLHDPLHTLSFATLSQSFPQKWASWLDASSASNSERSTGGGDGGLPDSISEIIESGGVDPREWVAEWIEEVLSTSVGIVAQQYVARRMGVGEGGLGRGKRRAEEDGVGGEAARAI